MKRGRPWQLASFAHMNSTGDKLFTLVSGLFTRAVFIFFWYCCCCSLCSFAFFFITASLPSRSVYILFSGPNLKIKRSTENSWTKNDELRPPNVPYLTQIHSVIKLLRCLNFNGISKNSNSQSCRRPPKILIYSLLPASINNIGVCCVETLLALAIEWICRHSYVTHRLLTIFFLLLKRELPFWNTYSASEFSDSPLNPFARILWR